MNGRYVFPFVEEDGAAEDVFLADLRIGKVIQRVFQHVAGADGKMPWTSLPEALLHAFDLYLDAICGKDVPLVSAREAAERVTVMEAFYRAAETNTWIEVEKQNGGH